MTNEEQFAKLDKMAQTAILCMFDSYNVFFTSRAKKFMSFNDETQKLLLDIEQKYNHSELYQLSRYNYVDLYDEKNDEVDELEEEVLDLEYDLEQKEALNIEIETLYDVQKAEILSELYKLNLRELEELAKIKFNTNSITVSSENEELNLKFSSTLEMYDDTMISYIKEKFINSDNISIIAKMVNDEIVKQVLKLGETKSIDAVEETKRILNQELTKSTKKYDYEDVIKTAKEASEFIKISKETKYE